MAILSRPDRENKHTLYDIPEEMLEQYRIPADKLARMFPDKEEHSRDEAVAIVAAGADAGGDVQAYSGQDVCYAWQCDASGKCAYVWWYC